MRIVLLAGQAYSVVNFRGQLLQEMVRRGHEVVVCTPAETSLEKAILALGVRYIPVNLDRTGMNPLRDCRLIVSLYRLFRELKPDCLLSCTVKPVIYGSIAARLAGVPAIFSLITGLGYAFIGTGKRKRLLNSLVSALYQYSLRFNRLVFFQNPDDRDLFIKNRMVTGPDYTRLMNGSGVDLDHFSGCSLQDGTHDQCFLLVARLLADKGIREYVAAARVLKQKYPAAKFQLLGPLDSNPTSCQPLELAAWQQEGVVEYCGVTIDVRPFLKAATVFVLPSYREGTPRSALEAMAIGRAIVTTDAPGCREVVIAGKNGFLVPIKDAAPLAEAMEKFILEPNLAIQMGRESRGMAEAKFDVHKVNSLLLQQMEIP